jgi:hypothetical protein
MTKAVQNVAPIPKIRGSQLSKGANAVLKLKQPKIPGAPKMPKTFA